MKIRIIIAAIFLTVLPGTGIGQLSNSGIVRQMGEGDVNAARQAGATAQNVSGTINAALNGLNVLLRSARDAQDLYNNSGTLANGECSPDFATSDNAMLPSSCSPRGECQECFQTATRELNFVRRQLGRLSCIYQNTKNFNNSAIAFGDNTSGIHAVTGLSWQYARADIVSTFNHFKQTYDRKYIDLIGSLEKALKGIDICEGKYGQPDWFQRSGFIYLEFMKDKYKRTD